MLTLFKLKGNVIYSLWSSVFRKYKVVALWTKMNISIVGRVSEMAGLGSRRFYLN